MQAHKRLISVHGAHDPAIGPTETLPAHREHQAHLLCTEATVGRFTDPLVSSQRGIGSPS